MITRIQPRAVLEVARQDIPGPSDVVNLITPERFERYRWYALLVTPALRAVGARVLWMARTEETLHGEPQAEKLLLVRYPSHRHFLAMTLNPYYFAINRLREAGVRRFEAGFTLASHTDAELVKRRRLVGVHHRDPETVTAAVDAGWKLVYATAATVPLNVLSPPRDSDPHPLRFPRLALFEPGGDLSVFGGDCSVNVYAREPRSAYRP
jgi:uncharacterized protein (DUF1330 family)